MSPPSRWASHCVRAGQCIIDIAPKRIEHVFDTNCGSESVETALKLADTYHRAKGQGARTRLIGRERGYHGVNFGGISVGGIVNNRKMFGTLLGGVDHLPHTHLPAQNSYAKGQPGHGATLADALAHIVALHGAETIAAMIAELAVGSTGVLIPPKSHLERLRAITRKLGILLIFDEVITEFGRLGSPFGAQHFDVLPDMTTTAKGLTNGMIPMGAVRTTAAGIATLETYRDEAFSNAPPTSPLIRRQPLTA